MDDFYYKPVRSWDARQIDSYTNADYLKQWGQWPTTLRAPTSDGVDASSQDDSLGPILDNSRISFRDRLYNLFTFYGNYSEFSTESYTFGTAFKNADSLESIHDVIHGATGSGGHMTYLDYSAYDPLFWLHHMMVDRAFALWQAVNPDSYVLESTAWQGSYTIAEGQSINGDTRKSFSLIETASDVRLWVCWHVTALDPFHRNANGDKWTANLARQTKSFGYTYPELANNASVSAVKAAINKFYGSTTGSNDSLLSKRFFDFDTPESESGLIGRDGAAKSAPPKRREYIANIVSDKFSCNGSYAVYIFLGTFDSSDPSCWPTQPNLVGTHAVFAMIPQEAADDAHQAKRAAMSGIQVTGTMPLNSALLERYKAGDLRSRKPESVEEYMANNLQYRVARVSLVLHDNFVLVEHPLTIYS
jgi:tyrosinase